MTIAPDLAPTRSGWVAACTRSQLIPERGVAVLIDGVQIAIFRISHEPSDFVYAVGHRDPFSDANVMARGIVGSVTGPDGSTRDTVASPMYKHVFDLATGDCLTDPSAHLPVHRTWVAGGVVYVEREPRPRG